MLYEGVSLNLQNNIHKYVQAYFVVFTEALILFFINVRIMIYDFCIHWYWKDRYSDNRIGHICSTLNQWYFMENAISIETLKGLEQEKTTPGVPPVS